MLRTRHRPTISIILPCRNEEHGLGYCLDTIARTVKQHNIDAEIIVSDSSSDRSPEIAKKHEVVLVKHDRPGYGRALKEGARVARGQYLLFMDADGTYDIEKIPAFLSKLESGNDVVMGHRRGATMVRGAMPALHKYIGNPILSWILRVCTGTKVRDAHCGMRALRRNVYNEMNLHTDGMEFASEFVLEAHRRGKNITELPINYYPRRGESKLRSFRDGWRHLRFILLYTPGLLFFAPGAILFIVGVLIMSTTYFGPITINGITLVTHPLLFAAATIITGYQLMIFAVFARTYAATHLDQASPWLERAYAYFTIERAGVLALIVTGIGLGLFAFIVYRWFAAGFGELAQIANATLALTLLILGVQTLFSSFMISLLGIKKHS